MKKNNNKGFTLAELLIVVAIIAVLTAIAIPVFTTSLDRAKASTDAANIRAGYASVAAKGIASTDQSGWYWLMKDGTVQSATSGTNNKPSNTYACRGKASNLDSETIVGSQPANGTTPNAINWDEKDAIYYIFTNSTVVTSGSGTTTTDGGVTIYKVALG